MTVKELNALEAALAERGYRKYTNSLTSSESYAWYKTISISKDADDETTDGYQMSVRVWDYSRFGSLSPFLREAYSLDFWASPLGLDARMDFESNWEPISDIDTFERMAAEFNAMVRKFVNPEIEER